MADKEHIEILKRGVIYWNKWRRKNSLLEPDLSFFAPKDKFLDGINLSNTDLSNSNFTNAYLAHANLNNAKCSHANFTDAFLQYATLRSIDFTFAKLRSARFYDTELKYANFYCARLAGTRFNDSNLCSANLSDTDAEYAVFEYADLTDAKCTNTNFSNADLYNCRLVGADLCQANFANACIGSTHFGDRDFRLVKGLETTWHRGPSPLSINSIYLSQGEISEAFVRGTGAPENFIEYLRALASKPIDYYTCFISYSHHNEDFAKRFYVDLQAQGVRCWFAPHNMHIGDKIHIRIDEAIHLQDKLLLILSKHSVDSDWVEHEVETALARERRDKRTILFPIRLDEAILERPYNGWAATVQNERHIGDFTGWKDHDRYQAAFEQLMRDLKKADE